MRPEIEQKIKEIKKELGIDVKKFKWIHVIPNAILLFCDSAKPESLQRFLDDINKTIEAINNHKQRLKWLYFKRRDYIDEQERERFEKKYSQNYTYTGSGSFSRLLHINLVIDVYCTSRGIYTTFSRYIKKDGKKYDLRKGDFLSYQKELQKLKKIVEFIIAKKELEKQKKGV